MAEPPPGEVSQLLGLGTMVTKALIHEVYERLVGQQTKRWHNRSHFFAMCAQAMRHILVDYARSRRSAKRGGGERALSLDEAVGQGLAAAGAQPQRGR